MTRYIAKRLVSMIITLIIISSLTFSLMHAIPGSPFTRERALPPEIEAALMEKYGLDDPLWMQYINYIGDVVQGDLGLSMQKIGVSVNDMIEQGLPVSAKIGTIAVIVILILGIPIGIISALKQNTIIDNIVMFIATIGIAVPSFVVGTFIMYIFGEKLKWIPAGGLDGPTSYIGPVIALAGFSLAYVTRLMRSSMLEVLRQDYIRTAKANGLSQIRVIGKHALKNALIPVITYVGPMVASILTGSFVIEKIFALPGLGKYFTESVTNRDYTVIMSITLFYASIYIFMVLLVDIAYAFIDPRIKFED
ncbi:MAG: peptide ABC transporter permease [Candidatus Epulonipiscioides saccharophilum]|nr:MAG: peptide ABC transporter permease [Epulopiscium sp. AS2M-Bin001]